MAVQSTNNFGTLKWMLLFKMGTKLVVFIGLWMQADNIYARASIIMYILLSFIFDGIYFIRIPSSYFMSLYFYGEVVFVIFLSIWFSYWPYLVLMQVLIGSAMLTLERKSRWWAITCLLGVNFLLLIKFAWENGQVEWIGIFADLSLSLFAVVVFSMIALLEERQQELERLNQKLIEYSEKVEELVVTKERNRIARDIHDTVAHGMTGLIMQLQAARKINKHDQDKANKLLEQSTETTRQVLQEMRQSVRALAPEKNVVYSNQILQEWLDTFSRSTGMEIPFNASVTDKKLSTSRQFVLYRVLQESLTNAKRHGNATKVQVDVSEEDSNLIYLIKDNGKGFAQLREGFGITGMKSRLREVGGEWQVKSDPGHGCEVKITLPHDGSHL